jgi:cation:H+ antiporter
MGMNWAAISWELPAGILFLALGGDILVRGAATVARSLQLSRLLIGVTLVSFGTSMPELVTSVRAALLDSPGIAVGNVVGSNTANVLLVLGAAALIYPVATPRNTLRRDGVMLVLATAVCIAVVYFGRLDRPIGAALVGLLFVYFVYRYMQERRTPELQDGAEAGDQGRKPANLWVGLFLAVVGVAMVVIGARWLVDSSIDFARQYNISETIIGLTIVAIGTSLPELITSVVAAIKRESGIALGNVLGSNIQNILGILGITAVVKPIDVPAEIINFDIWVMTGATVALLVFAATNRRFSRPEGLVCLVAFAAYMGYLIYLAMQSAPLPS